MKSELIKVECDWCNEPFVLDTGNSIYQNNLIKFKIEGYEIPGKLVCIDNKEFCSHECKLAYIKNKIPKKAEILEYL